MNFIGPSHRGHFSASTSHTRCSSVAQSIREGPLAIAFVRVASVTTTATLHDGPLGCTHTVPSEHTRGTWDGRCGGA
jgi:hypothetical protein